MSANPRQHRQAGWRDTGARLGCAAIASVAAVLLGLTAHHGLQLTSTYLSQATRHTWLRNNRQEECIYHAIRSRLPKHAKIYIDDARVDRAQELTELSTLWAVPQSSAATANWTISLVQGRRCDGLALKVRHI